MTPLLAALIGVGGGVLGALARSWYDALQRRVELSVVEGKKTLDQRISDAVTVARAQSTGTHEVHKAEAAALPEILRVVMERMTAVEKLHAECTKLLAELSDKHRASVDVCDKQLVEMRGAILALQQRITRNPPLPPEPT